MPAPSSKPIVFWELDAARVLQARASLGMAICHLVDATTSLEFGVPCETCENLRMILTFVDCASSLLQGAMERLGNWPEPPRMEKEER